jgi:hypothetical protein
MLRDGRLVWFRERPVSQAIGEQRLLPRVRDTSADTLIIADGFSCREQIAQATNRHALDLAEVIAMATRGVAGASCDRPMT